MSSLDRITFDPDKVAGRACIRGYRIPVATIVRCVASGMTTQEHLDGYPDLEPEDIEQALRYAARLTEDQFIPLGF
jgi:uncharacterized protein (DUF433 family)